MRDPEMRDIWEDLQANRAIRELFMEARKDNVLDKETLSKKSGISRRYIAKLEEGCANPDLSTLKRLARGLGKRLEIRFV